VPSPTYDLATDVGQVRLLIPDRPTLADGTPNPDGVCFTDAEIQALLMIEGGVKRAAALGKETIATDQALILKVLQQDQFRTDGAKLAAELRAGAAALRATAADDEAVETPFDYAELVTDPFAARERLVNQWLRGAG
jgi:type II secretory pathway component PulC